MSLCFLEAQAVITFSLADIPDTMGALEAVRPSMFSDITVSV